MSEEKQQQEESSASEKSSVKRDWSRPQVTRRAMVDRTQGGGVLASSETFLYNPGS